MHRGDLRSFESLSWNNNYRPDFHWTWWKGTPYVKRVIIKYWSRSMSPGRCSDLLLSIQGMSTNVTQDIPLSHMICYEEWGLYEECQVLVKSLNTDILSVNLLDFNFDLLESPILKVLNVMNQLGCCWHVTMSANDLGFLMDYCTLTKGIMHSYLRE